MGEKLAMAVFFYAPAHHRMAVSIELNDGRLFSPATAIVVVRLSAMAANAVNISHSIEKASAMSESSPLRFFRKESARDGRAASLGGVVRRPLMNQQRTL